MLSKEQRIPFLLKRDFLFLEESLFACNDSRFCYFENWKVTGIKCIIGIDDYNIIEKL